jgi:hypothetical protein
MKTPDAAISPELARYLHMRATRRKSNRRDGFINDWSDLRYGEKVQVFRDAEMLTAGTVDSAMPDGTGVWLIQDKGRGRRLFHESEDLRIRKA